MALVGGWMVSRALGETGRIQKALGSSHTGDEISERVEGSRSVVVSKPADELYETWRDPEQFSQIMGHVGEVSSVDEDRFRWTVHWPRGRDLSWETRIVEEEPGETVRWKTTGDATVPNEGSVRFRELPGDRGTEVTLSVSFDPPGGVLTSMALGRLDIAPETLAGEALTRFKSLAESGEIPTLEGNPSARGRGDLL